MKSKTEIINCFLSFVALIHNQVLKKIIKMLELIMVKNYFGNIFMSNLE